MGVGKSMKTFISAMTEQTGMGGYGSKIKSTPMGPFRWNDLTQLWENVNNGMVMNNISFQDMFIMGYETNSGDGGTPIFIFNWGNLLNMTNLDASVINEGWASTSGKQSSFSNATFQTFTSNVSLQRSAEYFVPTGITFTSINARKVFQSGNSATIGSGLGLTMGVGDSVAFSGRITPTGWTAGNSGYIWIRDTTNGVTLYGIPFVVTTLVLEPPE